MRCYIQRHDDVEYVETEQEQSPRWLVKLWITDLQSSCIFETGISVICNEQDDLYERSSLLLRPNMLIREFDYSAHFDEYEIVTNTMYYLRFKHVIDSTNSGWTLASKIVRKEPLWNRQCRGFWHYGLLMDLSWQQLLGDNNASARSDTAIRGLSV